jgi:hypothetical protein
MSHSTARTKRGGARKSENPWDAAQSTVLMRKDTETGQETPLESGVNFFVLMLEKLGATTRYSCEGHPDGFYIVFEGSAELARAISHASFFTVEVWEGEADYAMRISEHLFERYVGPWNEAARKEHLRLAAVRWVERFGPLADVAPTD